MKYTRREHKGWWRVIWESSAFTIFLVLILVLSLIKMTREIMVRREIDREIRQLENNLVQLEGQKSEVERLISYLDTDEYVEKESRLKLNLLKPGEKQINLSDSAAELVSPQEDDKSNIAKWFDYFFVK